MAKEEGAKTVVYGGKKGVQQEYCGTVGGQSTDFSTIDTEIKVRVSPPHFPLPTPHLLSTLHSPLLPPGFAHRYCVCMLYVEWIADV